MKGEEKKKLSFPLFFFSPCRCLLCDLSERPKQKQPWRPSPTGLYAAAVSGTPTTTTTTMMLGFGRRRRQDERSAKTSLAAIKLAWWLLLVLSFCSWAESRPAKKEKVFSLFFPFSFFCFSFSFCRENPLMFSSKRNTKTERKRNNPIALPRQSSPLMFS